MTNLNPQHADILSDLAAALAGSIGIAPTSNLDPTRQNPSMVCINVACRQLPSLFPQSDIK